MGAVATKSVQGFYRAAVIGLRVLDAGAGRARRFGVDADATWRAFRGELGESERLDLLIRDAAATQPAAFAPRVVFGLPGLAADEPFGPEWPGIGAGLAASLIGEAGRESVPDDLGERLGLVARAWGVEPRPVSDAVLDRVRPATRLLIAGAGVIVSLARVLAGRSGFDIADQAVLVSDSPAERQLFGMARMLLGSTAQVRMVSVAATAEDVRAAGVGKVDLALVSDDATAEQRDAVDRLVAELGG